jgi:prefoldin subunit 5
MGFEERMAKIERAFEQIDQRLGCLETEITSLRAEIRTDIQSLRSEVKSYIQGLK